MKIDLNSLQENGYFFTEDLITLDKEMLQSKITYLGNASIIPHRPMKRKVFMKAHNFIKLSFSYKKGELISIKTFR